MIDTTHCACCGDVIRVADAQWYDRQLLCPTCYQERLDIDAAVSDLIGQPPVPDGEPGGRTILEWHRDGRPGIKMPKVSWRN